MDTNYIIETKNLTKQYGSQKSVADLNIHVKRGRIYGLLGRNGAGKTTTMKMLLGLTKPTSGEVKIWGKSLQGNEKKLLPRIGSLIESPGFYPNLTGTENLRIFATLRGVPNNHAIKDALDLVGLPYKDKKLFSQYSLGMKQRLAIALAVMHDPELLILDEPINGLDPIGIAEVRSFIRELCDARGKTILISSHILSEISLLADDIGIIDHGALLEEESLAGLINFTNMIITNIITRRHEFATMQSIGMTGKQLRRLMVYEGIYYAAGADIIGGAVAAILAVTVLKSALNSPSMWFFTLNITLVPVLVIGVLYLLLAAVIPLIVLHFFNKGTVVERLRTSE